MQNNTTTYVDVYSLRKPNLNILLARRGNTQATVDEGIDLPVTTFGKLAVSSLSSSSSSSSSSI